MATSATAATDRARDEHGRFTSAQTADETAEEAATEESVADEAEVATEASTATAEATAPTDETAATEAAPTEDESEVIPAEATPVAAKSRPFSFRADGSDVAVEGATVRGDEIVIPRDAWFRHVQPHLADRRGWERERSRMQSQLRTLDPERNEAVVRAQHLLGKLDAIQAALEKGDEGPLVDLVNNFTQRFSVWRTEAENEALKRAVKSRDEVATAEQNEQELEQLLPQLAQGLLATVDNVLQADYKGLGFKSDDVASDLWELFERGAQVFVDLRDPATAQARGVAPDIYVDTALVQRYLDRPARVIRERSAAMRSKAAAAKQNAAVLAPKKGAPTVPAKGSPEAGGRDIDPTKAKTKDEYEKSMREKYGGMV